MIGYNHLQSCLGVSPQITYNSGSSLSSGAFTTSSASLVPVTNLSKTITTSGNSVMVSLVSDQSLNICLLQFTSAISKSSVTGTVSILRDSTIVAQSQVYFQNTAASAIIGIAIPISNIWFVETPPPGRYNYSLQVSTDSGTALVQYAVLNVTELV